MALLVTIKVVPQSGRQEWVVDDQGQLKCFLTAAPERGKANQELIKVLAKALGVGQYALTIVSGATTRTKVVKIAVAIDKQELIKKLIPARPSTGSGCVE